MWPEHDRPRHWKLCKEIDREYRGNGCPRKIIRVLNYLFDTFFPYQMMFQPHPFSNFNNFSALNIQNLWKRYSRREMAERKMDSTISSGWYGTNSPSHLGQSLGHNQSSSLFSGAGNGSNLFNSSLMGIGGNMSLNHTIGGSPSRLQLMNSPSGGPLNHTMGGPSSMTRPHGGEMRVSFHGGTPSGGGGQLALGNG